MKPPPGREGVLFIHLVVRIKTLAAQMEIRAAFHVFTFSRKTISIWEVDVNIVAAFADIIVISFIIGYINREWNLFFSENRAKVNVIIVILHSSFAN